ncbi:hypothetical protein PLICRDRAFT_190066 [Plicaturopsis crispa FD-325 SS-3]|nr:hypothetical protein PLICRDRAFT_190066 [Plicaturopsis crispa FD-325 SS-3]
MLKIWKQGWKNQDSSRRAQSEQVDDGSPDTQISGASSSGSHLDSAAAAPQSTVDAAPGPDIVPVQTEEAGARRKRTSPNVAEEHARPAKKLKTEEEDVPAQRDTLGNHLPEIFDVDKSVSTNAASFEQQVLDQVKMENTIAVLGSSSAANKVSIDFLTWAVELERRRPLHKPRPTTLFVVE